MKDSLNFFNDHASLHSAGRALENRAERTDGGDIDVRSLLQLANQIIFAESISLNGFETPQVADRTNHIIESLCSLGIKKKNLFIEREQHLLFEFCDAAAEIFADKLTFDRLRFLSQSGNARPELSAAQIKKEKHLHDIIKAATPELPPTPDRMDDATHYMFSNEKLWEKIMSMKGKRGWTQNHTAELIVLSRIYLSGVFAKHHGAKYVPAVARAVRIRAYRNYVYKLFSEVIENSDAGKLKKLRLNRGNIGIPSVTYALINSSKGHPEGVIESALLFREKAYELRKWLSKHINIYENQNPSDEDRRKLNGEILDVSKTLDYTLGPGSEQPRFIDALEFAVVFPAIPKLIVKPEEMRKWWNFFKRKKVVTMLTDISLSLNSEKVYGTRYTKLLKAATKNSK
jgi:hypothetical protein